MLYFLIENGKVMELSEDCMRKMEENLLVYECDQEEYQGSRVFHLTPDFEDWVIDGRKRGSE